MSETLQVLPQKHTATLRNFFPNKDEYYKSRDEFLNNLKPDLEDLNEKRRKSEEQASVKRYR